MTEEKMTEKDLIKRDSKGLWLKGQSGNPSGRPVRINQARYMAIMNEVVDDPTWYAICKRAAQDAIDGSHPARRWVADYIIGPPIKQSEVSVSGGVSLDGPSLDRRVKQIMAILVAVLLKGEQIDGMMDSMIDEQSIIDGMIIESDIIE